MSDYIENEKEDEEQPTLEEMQEDMIDFIDQNMSELIKKIEIEDDGFNLYVGNKNGSYFFLPNKDIIELNKDIYRILFGGYRQTNRGMREHRSEIYGMYSEIKSRLIPKAVDPQDVAQVLSRDFSVIEVNKNNVVVEKQTEEKDKNGWNYKKGIFSFDFDKNQEILKDIILGNYFRSEDINFDFIDYSLSSKVRDQWLKRDIKAIIELIADDVKIEKGNIIFKLFGFLFSLNNRDYNKLDVLSKRYGDPIFFLYYSKLLNLTRSNLIALLNVIGLHNFEVQEDNDENKDTLTINFKKQITKTYQNGWNEYVYDSSDEFGGGLNTIGHSPKYKTDYSSEDIGSKTVPLDNIKKIFIRDSNVNDLNDLIIDYIECLISNPRNKNPLKQQLNPEHFKDTIEYICSLYSDSSKDNFVSVADLENKIADLITWNNEKDLENLIISIYGKDNVHLKSIEFVDDYVCFYLYNNEGAFCCADLQVDDLKDILYKDALALNKDPSKNIEFGSRKNGFFDVVLETAFDERNVDDAYEIIQPLLRYTSILKNDKEIREKVMNAIFDYFEDKEFNSFQIAKILHVLDYEIRDIKSISQQDLLKRFNDYINYSSYKGKQAYY